jgi:hypothetical protein
MKKPTTMGSQIERLSQGIEAGNNRGSVCVVIVRP